MAQVKHLSMAEGLSSNYIFDITQDSNGFVWLATDNGLSCYDGDRFIVYNKHNSGLSANELNAVLADTAMQRLWIGTQRNGLCYYDENTYEILPFPRQKELLSEDVTDISRASNGGIWITHYHNGIDYYNAHTDTLIHYSFVTHPLIAGNHWTAIEDGNKHLIVGHVNQGLSIIDLVTNTAQNFRTSTNPGLPSDEVLSLCADKANRIWVGTSKGLALMTSDGEFVSLRNKNLPFIQEDKVYDITYSDDNFLRVTSETKGVWILDLNSFDVNNLSSLNYEHESNGLGINVRRVFLDSFGNTWHCHYGSGADVSLHLKQPFAYDITPMESVWGVYRDDKNDGAILLGTKGAVSMMKNGECTRYPLTSIGIPNGALVRCFFRTADGILWLGTNEGGLYKCNFKSQYAVKVPSDTPELDVHAISQSPKGSIILGTNKGLFININNNVFPLAEMNDRLGDLTVQTITFDAYGQLWVGTFGQGLYVFNPNKELIANIDDDNGLPSNAVSHVIPDSRGRIWVATRDGIVMIPDAKNPTDLKLIDERKRLSNSCIRAIVEDKATGNIWMSTNDGISYFDVTSNEIKNYDCRDGIPLGFFNDASVSASKDGVIYFGSGNGLCYFRPQDVTMPRKWPDIKILSTNIDDHNVNIRFAMPDISLSDVLNYEYKVVPKGIFSDRSDNNTGWMSLKIKEIQLYGISNGEYEVRIRSLWHDESWDGLYNSYFFTIPTPWYLSWYFLTFVIAAIGFSAWQLIELNKRRRALVRDAEEATKKQIILEQFVPKDLAIKEEQEDLIAQITKIIEGNLEKTDLDVEFIALQLNVSHSTLYRKVKGLTGLSVTELVKKVRLRTAAKMLDAGTMSIKEVADATGFSTATYFRLNFKKEFGISPSAYAKGKKN